MARIIISADHSGLVLDSFDNSFSSFQHFLEFLEYNSIKVIKYEKDNLYFEVQNFKVKIESYSKVIYHPELESLKDRIKRIYFNKKMRLEKQKHKKVVITRTALGSVLLGSLLVYSLNNVNFDFLKQEKALEKMVIEQAVVVEASVPLSSNVDNTYLLKMVGKALGLDEVSINYIISSNLIDAKSINNVENAREKIAESLVFLNDFKTVTTVLPDLTLSQFQYFCYEFDLDYKYIAKEIVLNKTFFSEKFVNSEFALKLFMYDYTIGKEIVRTNEYNRDEIEKMLIAEFNKYEITAEEDIATMLAIFRLETSHGESQLCRKANNFGGHKKYRVIDEEIINTPIYYATPEIGIFRFFEVYERIKKQAFKKMKNLQINKDATELEDVLRMVYAPEELDWSDLVKDVKKTVIEDYSFDLLKKGR